MTRMSAIQPTDMRETRNAPSVADASARVADALQVLVLAVESCQRDLDPRWPRQANVYAVNRRLLAIAGEMRSLLQALGQPDRPSGGGDSTT